MSRPGMLRGRHYTEYVEQVKDLKRAGNLVDALALLEQLMAAAEAEASKDRLAMPPWYAEQAALVHRKLGDRASELAVLRRYVAHPYASRDSSVHERLRKLQG